MKLTVANGYPVTSGPNRQASTADLDEVTQRYYDLGSTLAADYGLAGAFQETYASLVGFKGMAPSAAFDEALRVLDIVTPDDFIYFTDEDHG